MAAESLNRAINAVRGPTQPGSVGGFAVGAIIALAIIGITVSICASATAAIRGCYNGRIAFDSVRNGARDIYVIDAPPEPKEPGTTGEGSPPTPTATPTRLTTGLHDAKPSWSPPDPENVCESGKTLKPRPTMIAFQRTTSDGNTNIYAINAAKPEPTEKAVPVTHDVGTDTTPAWAPRTLALGESGSPKYPPIAFERSINGHHDILITNFDGTCETNLTKSSGADYTNPSWAAGTDKESWLTFDSNQGGVREVWVMQVSHCSNNQFGSSTPREVTAGQPASSNPSWFVFDTPWNFNELFDSVAFAGPDQEGGPSQIDIAGSTTPRFSGEEPFTDPNAIGFYALTNDACENTAPEWSPTGEFIVYQKTCADGKSDIYLLNPGVNETSGDINLTEHVGDNQNPDWEAAEQLDAEYFPVRPLGRRGRKRARSASFGGGGGARTGGGAGTGGDNGPTAGATGNGTGKPTPTPVFSAQVKQIIVRGHGRSRVILIVLRVNARATVVGELEKGRRQVASHRWHVNGGTARLRFRVPLRARAGMYQIRVIMRAASGPTLSVARRVRIGS
jgi:hypothetical protein